MASNTSENSESITSNTTNNTQISGAQAVAAATEQQDHPAGAPLSDFILQLEDYSSTIPDLVTSFYLRRAGFQTSDPRIIRLISIASQKLISDITNDALQHSKMKASGQSSKKQGKEKKFTLTMEDLSPAMAEYGINVKKPCYYI